ncbi:MAG TPA: bifunctional nuclease family protein [Acidimicrobiales bacterium]|nr:bifunctional nuclease family protein [Acidimicrobiales bacterium]
MVEMHLASVRVEMPTNNPVVLLQETSGDRTLLIFIGTHEAQAIVEAIQGTTRPRPMTHELLRDILNEVGATLERVVLTELVDSVYFAELHINLAGRVHIVSSRPSDAMAIAARMGTPIFAEEALLEEAGIVLEDDDEEAGNPDDLVDQFHEFIKDVRPEDFST